MSKRSVIALIVVAAVVIPVALGGIAVVMGGDDSRIVGALRADEYQRVYGTDLYLETATGGQYLGQARSVTGCGSRAGLSTAAGPNGGVTKELTALAAQPCVVQLAAGRMRAAFFDLLDDVLTGQTGRTGFWLVNLNRTGGVGNGLHIEDALMEVTFGKLDTDAQDEEVEIVLSLRPDSVAELATCCGSFSPAQGPAASGSHQQGVFRNRFNASISGVSGGEDIVEISEWTIKQEASGTDVVVELGDLALTVMRHPNNDFRQWFTQFAVNGQNTDSDEEQMTIQVRRGTSSNSNAFTLSFTGVGVRAHELVGWGTSGNAGQVLKDRFIVYVEGASAAGGIPGAAQTPTNTTPTNTTPTNSTPTNTTPTNSTPTNTTPTTPTTTTPTIGLVPPADVKVEVGREGEVALVWAAVKGAETYVVLSSRRPGGAYEQLAETGETRHTLSRLEPGTTVYLVLRAARGEEQSKNSAEIAVEIP